MFKNLWLIALVGLLLVGCASNPESVITYESLPTDGDPVNGAVLFNNTGSSVPACSACHNESAAAAPHLDETYPEIAANRIDDMDAHKYTFYAIVEPWRHLAAGYGNAMYNQYDERLSPQEIADLMAYLLELDASAE